MRTMKATARLRYMKGSAQKVRLVADLVRGKKVNDAVAILSHTSKVAARDILKTLRSAVANAEQKEARVDIDELVVTRIFVDKGPQEKRVRPAPMGRAYRVVKRTAHLTVQVAERPLKIARVAEGDAATGKGNAAAPKPARAKKSTDAKKAAAKA